MSKPEKLRPEEHAEQVRQGQDAAIARQQLERHCAALRKQVFETFARSSAHDHEGHRMLKAYLRVLDDLEGRLATAIATGETARKKLLTTEKDSTLQRIRKVV